MRDLRPFAVLVCTTALAVGAVAAAVDLADSRDDGSGDPRGDAMAFDRVTGGLGAGTALRFDGIAPLFDARLGGADAALLDPVNGGPGTAAGEEPR